MHHKLQPSNRKNDGQNSVGRNPKQSSTNEIASNDASAECAPGTADFTLEIASTENPQPLRCEVARSVGYDPTGERAVPCGAAAQVICEHCGPMCSPCAEETFCFYGEHRFVEAEQKSETTNANSGAECEERKPFFEVVYLELRCAYCETVRLALPLAARPDPDWKLVCPICSTPVTWTYLAHGLTQRELPYYERFDTDALFRGRIPWDQLAAMLDDDD